MALPQAPDLKLLGAEAGPWTKSWIKVHLHPTQVPETLTNSRLESLSLVWETPFTLESPH